MSRYTLKADAYSSHTLLLDRFPQVTGPVRVLDVGCANGEFAALVAERGYAVTGLERPGGFDDRFPATVKLVPADLEAGLPELDERYRYIVCADILEHLRDPARLLRQLAGLLEPGGELIASLPNSGNLYFRLVVLGGKFPREDKGLFDRTHLHFYTWDGWQELFGDAGYRIEHVRCSGIPLGVRFPEWKGSAAVRAAERVSYELARLRKEMFAYQFVVTARAAR